MARAAIDKTPAAEVKFPIKVRFSFTGLTSETNRAVAGTGHHKTFIEVTKEEFEAYQARFQDFLMNIEADTREGTLIPDDEDGKKSGAKKTGSKK